MSKSKLRIIQYELPGGWTLWVGGTDADNDYLSTSLAAREDYWFHAEGVPGGHVILRAKCEEEPDRETLRRAAAVAAYHSRARGAGTARVYCTRARYVTKPRGAKIGTVHVTRGTVFKIRPDISPATRVGAAHLGAEPPEPAPSKSAETRK
ncbi:MAG: NFACT RNA binding domain-containing protein [Candidatus Binatia bacterium]